MSQKAKQSGSNVAWRSIKNLLLGTGRVLATVIMVGIITGCIVACVMTVYIMRYIGGDNAIDLEQAPMSYTTFIYAIDPDTGEEYEVARLYKGGENRVWVDYEDINDYTKNAIVAIEDKRYWEHQGVDWRRTIGAFVGLLMPVEGTTTGGGSTITQQLIKNITNDSDVRVDRKVREIFRAIDLNQKESKENILEAYLNVVAFGNGTHGIQAAANLYFGKEAKDLTLAESAAIVGITQYPGYYNPFTNPENNKRRREWILKEMLEQGKINQQEHDSALREQLHFQQEIYEQRTATVNSYFVDYVLEQVIQDLMREQGYTRRHASDQIYGGGYRIYITMDKNIQAHLEEIYSSTEGWPTVHNRVYPQSACVITDPNGKILAMVGGIGEKTDNRVLNRATSRRQAGSTIKPIASYAQAFEYDRVTWSTKVDDNPILLEEPGKEPISWPRNHYGRYLGFITIEEALQRSTNTVAVKLVQQIGERRVFDFLTKDLLFDSLVERQVIGTRVVNDVNLSAMALGGMTFGVTPVEMVGGFQIYANGGYFTRPYAYTEVRDADGRLVLRTDTMPRQVISEDTSVVVNRLMQRVVNSAPGTGRRANLSGMPTAGKTGTSSDDVDQWFIGMTPYYVCQVWMGYDEKLPENNYGTIRYSEYAPPIIFNRIMAPLHEGLEYKNFPESDGVVSREFCTVSGNLATANCPRGSGWYKTRRLPSICTGIHYVPGQEDEEQQQQPDTQQVDEQQSPGINWSNPSTEPDRDSGVAIFR